MKIISFLLASSLVCLAASHGEPMRPHAGTLLQAPDGSQVSWEDLISRYSGKVIYLDLWASWCGPCREQAPALESLKEAFRQDSVVFLSVSIDAEAADWKDALQAIGEDGDPHSFLLLDGKHSSLNGFLHIKGVPRYAVIDRSGRFVDKDAPFPSDPNVVARIKAALDTK